MDYLINVNQGKAHEFNREVGEFKQEHTVIQNKLDRLMDFLVDGSFTREEFLRKKAQLKERQYELSELIKSYDKVDDKLSKKLADLVCISTNAYETFKGSTIAEKRELLNFIFSNLTLEGCKLHYVLAFPFTELQKVANCPEWRALVSSLVTLTELRMATVQCSLPLSLSLNNNYA